MSYLLIFIGSGIGGILRFLVGSNLQKLTNGWLFPIGTLSVNMIGCLLIGFLTQLVESKGLFPSEQRLFIFVGLLGGFTTFSSFGYETVQLLKDGQYLYGSCNIVLQVFLGLSCVWLGSFISKLI